MDMSNYRAESHIAQQSRRDKLRVQQCSSSMQQHNLEDFTRNNLEHSLVNNPDLIQVRDVRNNANLLYDPLVSSEIINFSTSNLNVLSAQRDANALLHHQELGATQQPNINRPMIVADDLFTNMTHPSSFHGFGNWKSLDHNSQSSSSNWMMANYAGGSSGRESNQNSMLVGEVLSNNMKMGNDISTSRKYLKPDNYNEYHLHHQDVQSSTLSNLSSEISSQDRQKHYGGDMHFSSPPPLYQNNVQDVVTVASFGTRGLETGHGTWADTGSELVLLPNHGNQSSALHHENVGAWTNRPAEESSHQWSTELALIARKSTDQELRNIASNATTQGLSLSLSSHLPSKMHVTDQFGEGYESQDLRSRTDVFKEPQDLNTSKSGYLCSVPKPSIIGKGCGKSLQELVGTSSYNIRSTGPLGPFTGYATILKSSRFLKPAQELLDEFFNISESNKIARTCDVSERIYEDQVSGSASADGDHDHPVDREVGAKGNNSSGISSSTIYSSNQISCDGGVGSSSCESYRPEYQQKKAKLLYLQEEVCRRYKLYHQQMQMVVSSFESVAGLSAATPYVSIALKSISKNFRCLKNTISNQLNHVMRALGEDLLSSATGTSTGKSDTNMPRLKYMDQSLPKQKSGGSNVGFLDPQQHIWRPQRGLPERSVAILRAWLFEHFLHPYPTDTDKHMLATQTGLSRNQVSNWFINARVRVWKPMVEEIHMLETNQNTKRSDGRSASEGTGKLNAVCDEQMDYSGIGSSVGTAEDGFSAEQRNQEKRSRVECQVNSSLDRSLMSFMPYQRRGLEVGGLGAVSLTLGLRHGVESSQQHQQQEDQLRRQFGGQMIHDFVG